MQVSKSEGVRQGGRERGKGVLLVVWFLGSVTVEVACLFLFVLILERRV